MADQVFSKNIGIGDFNISDAINSSLQVKTSSLGKPVMGLIGDEDQELSVSGNGSGGFIFNLSTSGNLTFNLGGDFIIEDSGFFVTQQQLSSREYQFQARNGSLTYYLFDTNTLTITENYFQVNEGGDIIISNASDASLLFNDSTFSISAGGFEISNVPNYLEISGSNLLGLRYDQDYASSNVGNDRWIPDKKYVDDKIVTALEDANIFYSVNNSVTTIPGNGNRTTLPIFSNVITNDGAYNVISATEVEINETGRYLVSYKIPIDNAANSRTSGSCILQRDTGGGFVDVTDTQTFGYHRNGNNGEDTYTSEERPFLLSSGDRFRVQAFVINGGNLETISGTGVLKIEKIRDNVIVTPNPPNILSGPPDPDTIEGENYEYQAAAVGVDVVWTLSNEPSGMTINPLSGLLEYTPTTTGTFTNIQIIASNAGGSDTLIFDLLVNPNPVIPTNRIFWLRAGDIGLSNGANVSSWTSKDNAITLSQGVLTEQPQYITSAMNGQDVILFSSGQELTGSLNVPITTLMVFVVYRTSATARGTFWSFGDGGLQSFAYNDRFSAGDNFATFDGSSGNNSPGDEVIGAFNDGNPHVFTAYTNGSQTLQRVDKINTNVYNEAAPAAVLTDFTVGELVSGGFFFDGQIAEVIAYSTVLSVSQIEAIEDYLISKYGI